MFSVPLPLTLAPPLSTLPSRNAEDIVLALETGERWRADVRAAAAVKLEEHDGLQTLWLQGAQGEAAWQFSTNTVLRRVGRGPWVRLMANVKASTMQPDPRQRLTAWRWELELKPRAKASVKASRTRPLFTFLAVPQSP